MKVKKGRLPPFEGSSILKIWSRELRVLQPGRRLSFHDFLKLRILILSEGSFPKQRLVVKKMVVSWKLPAVHFPASPPIMPPKKCEYYLHIHSYLSYFVVNFSRAPKVTHFKTRNSVKMKIFSKSKNLSVENVHFPHWRGKCFFL